MKRGFTLFEMLAATALAALLTVTMLVVISSLGRERRGAAAAARSEVPPDVVELIRWDLVNARQLREEPGRVTLTGFGALDAGTLSPLAHRPVEVVYEVRRAAGRSWLVRRQRGQHEDAPDLTLVELLCAGVADLRLTPLDGSDESTAATRPVATRPATAPTTAASAQPADAASLGACVRLHVRWDEPERTPLDRILVLR